MQPEFIPPSTSHGQSKKLSGKLIIIIVSVLVLLIIGAFVVIAMTSKDPTAAMDKLNARMASLIAYTAEGNKNAQLDTLRKANSDASILLGGDAGTIKTATTAAGAKGANKTIIETEKNQQKKILDDLNKATVDGRFDKEYLSQLETVLADTQTLLSRVNAESPQKTVKSATKNTYDHITTILASFDAIDTN